MATIKKEYSEDFTLSLLFQNSSFTKFYVENREIIKKPIIWASAVEDIKAEMTYGTISGVGYVIFAKKFPIPVNIVFSAAHELQHILCCQEGYPVVSFINGGIPYMPRLNKIISDMINDPIVNSKIIKYGFDLWEYIDRGNIIHCSETTPLKIIPPEHKVILTTLFVKKQLDWETAYETSPLKENMYAKWLKNNYPDLLPKAQELLDMVKTVGYDCPEKVTRILRRTIRILGFQDNLKIDYIN
jgi:hypothetical protein